MKQTQRQRLLQAFQERGELYVYEIMAPRPNGLGIAQYNARIKELRESGHPIINKEPGHFVYKSDTAERVTMPVDIQELIKKRDELRRQWKEAKSDSDKRIIEARGKALTFAIEKAQFEQTVKEAVL